jgi:transposase
LDAADMRVYLDFEYRRVACPDCGVRQERLPWLSDTRRATQRFAQEIGRQCRELSEARVAAMHQMSWGQVRRLDMAYMENLLAKHPPPKRLRAIGMDEVSIRKGHTYAIVVADLERNKPIWMSESPGRKEEDLDTFFVELGARRSRKIEIAVMDMWKPFRNSTLAHAPQVRIVFDKFHVIKHLSDALDEVRRREYKRVNEKDRKFIKGQRYTLLSNRANLDEEGRRSLKLLLKANKRLHKAYLLKEIFGQLWDYNTRPAPGSFSTTGRPSSSGNAWSLSSSSPPWSSGTGTASWPTATRTTRCRSVSWKASTTRSGPFSAGLLVSKINVT